jgi:hypothetical protein
MEISTGNSTVVNGKVYFGGAVTTEEDECTIYCYDPFQDLWSALPPFNFRHFGLGHIEGNLVTVGGAKQRPSRERTNDLYVFIESTGRWRKAYPPMPTARSSTVVFSLEHALIVAGGYSRKGERKVSENTTGNIVEVFKVKESQWCRADNLPLAVQNMSGVVLNSCIYFIRGIRVGATYSQVISSSISKLIKNAVPVNESMGTEKSKASDGDTASPWKMLPDIPTNKTAITSLAGLLITIGGEENTIHTYSPSIDSWVHVGSLPELRLLTTISVLSPMEILMIGGSDGSKDMNTVYKGTLQLST